MATLRRCWDKIPGPVRVVLIILGYIASLGARDWFE